MKISSFLFLQINKSYKKKHYASRSFNQVHALFCFSRNILFNFAKL